MNSLYDKYISNCDWYGTLKVDGGWSNFKNEIMIEAGKLPPGCLDFMPEVDITNLETNLRQRKDDEELQSTLESNHRYSIACPKSSLDYLFKLINSIRDLGVKKQEYVLDNYNIFGNTPSPSKNIYRLIIEVEDEIRFKILEPLWIPTYPTAEHSELGTMGEITKITTNKTLPLAAWC